MLRRAWFLLLLALVAPLGAREAPGTFAGTSANQGGETAEVPFFQAEALKPAIPEALRIDNKGGMALTREGVEFSGPVKVSGGRGQEIFANRARLVTGSGVVALEGDVRAYLEDAVYVGERATYHYRTDYLDTSAMAASAGGVIMEAGNFVMEQRKRGPVFVGRDAGVTFHDAEKPDFWLRARQTTFYPGDRVSFRGLKVEVGEVPVFYLPYLSQPLDSDLGYHFMPGLKSTWGAYLLNTYGTMLGGEKDPETGDRDGAWLLSQWRMDMMSRRGVGLGAHFEDKRRSFGREISGLDLYYLNDLNPGIQRSGIPRGDVNEDRWALEFKHRLPLPAPDDAEWRLDSNIALHSDRHFLEDFQPSDYRTNPAPDNTVGVFRRSDTSLASLYMRFQGNDFYQVATRLPELVFDHSRRPVFGTPILHEGTISLGWLGIEQDEALRRDILDPLLALGPGDPRATALLRRLPPLERQVAEQLRALAPGDPQAVALRRQLSDTSFTRFHTYQDFSMPVNVGGWLNLVPSVGVGFTSYMDVDGALKDESRGHLRAGMEASVKFSRTYGGVRSHGWGLEGLRHVVQPYGNWSLLSSDDLPALYPKVDRLTFATRPPPLTPERYSAIDDLESWNILRLGTRHHLLTRRDGAAHEWAFMDTYIDCYLDDPEMDRHFSNLYNDILFHPVPWLSFGLQTQFPLVNGGSGFNEITTFTRFNPTPNSEIHLGYRWLDSHPVLSDSSRVDLRTYLRLSEQWGLGTRHVFEMDDGVLEYQNYSLHRDMGSWVAALGLFYRDNRIKDEYGFMFSLTLKDLSSFSLPLRMDL